MGSNIRKFTQIAFENEPSENTPLSASNLNAIQTRINDLFNDLPNGTLNVVTNANEEQIEGVYIISSTGTSNFPFNTTATNFKRGFLIVLRRYGQRDIMQIAIAPSKKSIWIRTGVTGTGTIQSLSAWTRLYESETILYEDTTGTGVPGNITLNDSVANYDEILIFMRRPTSREVGWNYDLFQEYLIHNPNYKTVSLALTFADIVGSTIQTSSKVIQIENNLITTLTQQAANTDSSSSASINLYIYKVIGYKKIGGEV